MASHNGKNFHIELTEIESKLRQLLLDVANYIDENENAPSEDATAVHVPQALAEEKIVLRWTGGWVRDKLLKVGSHDIDLAINKMTGEHFGFKMQEYLEIPGNAEKHGLIDKNDKSSTQDKSKKIAPGLHKIEANPEKSKNLETATTKIMGIDLDLVNLRKETYNEISRNPEMEFGTAEEDAMRRDATVNAMFYNLHSCEIEDFTKRGHDDMAAGIIRTPLEPMQTFKDDPLRVLRLIRFASRLDYTIEPDTAQAMANSEIQSVLKVKISRERVGIELEKMLRGPRPRMALELIDRFGLYRTVFTDPTRQLPSEPEIDYFPKAYDFIDSILSRSSQNESSDLGMLTRTDEEKYLAWISAAMMPWADAPTVPHPKPTQRPLFTAYLVAREGFKAPNKICDVVALSLSNGDEIRKIVAQCAKGLRRPDTVKTTEVDPTARDTLGMALRRWGPTWRTQVLFNLTYEVVVASLSRQELLKSYSDFLSHLTKLNILEVDTFKPLLKGTDLAKALSVKPGPWMKDALDVVMAWQLRNPDSTDTSAAVEAVKVSRNGHTDSELSLRLAYHFIQLTIPPFFSQSKSTTSSTNSSRQPSPWKDASAQPAIDLLEWSIASLNRKEIETNWRYLVPPILKMIDDMDSMWKVKGCQLLQLLLKSFGEPSQAKNKMPMGAGSNKDSNFLQRTGYHSVFSDTLFPLLTYLPPLTPEAESRVLIQEALSAVTLLARLLPAGSTNGDERIKFLDRIMREGVIGPLGHFSTTSTYPDLAMVIIKHMQVLLRELQIESVKHLSSILALLSSILQEPFVLSHKGLVVCTLQGLREVMLNTWPRIPGHRCQIMMGLSAAWIRCGEEGHTASNNNDEVKRELQETVAMLDTVMQAVEDQGLRTLWEKEKAELMEASAACKSLFSAYS